MRRLLVLVAILAGSTAAAPAALAHPETARDPFAPLIAPPEPAAAASGVPGAPTAPPAQVEPDPNDELPGTGTSTGSWFGIAYFLVVFGAGAVGLSKALAPPAPSAR